MLYLVKKVAGSVRRPSLRHEPGEGHAVQHLRQEIVLEEATLAQEGRLQTKMFTINKSLRRIDVTRCDMLSHSLHE